MYIESICDDCHRFVANELKYLAIHPELLSLVDVRLHIFGKGAVIERDPPYFSCQFGQEGCVGNEALLCIYNHSPSFVSAVRVMECMYEVGYYTEASIRMCFEKFNESASNALQCFKGSEAAQLLLEAADATPRLRWVPAFSDGERIRIDTRNFIQFLCSRIGDDAPDVCFSNKHTVGMETDLCFFLFYKQGILTQQRIHILRFGIVGANRFVITGVAPSCHSTQLMEHGIPTGELFATSQRPFDIKHGDYSLLLLRRWIRGLYLIFPNGLHNQPQKAVDECTKFLLSVS